jgi:hypothetical protein
MAMKHQFGLQAENNFMNSNGHDKTGYGNKQMEDFEARLHMACVNDATLKTS